MCFDRRSKVRDENADLRLDKQRLLGVLRRHREGELSDAFAAHRDRLRKRHMSENEVQQSVTSPISTPGGYSYHPTVKSSEPDESFLAARGTILRPKNDY